VLDNFAHPAPSPSLFVHGAGGNNLLWKRTLQYLSGDSVGVAVNLPGHPSGEITCRSVRDYSESVAAFIRDSRLPSPTVVGHSMGSAVALTLSIEHPDLVGGLVLVGAGAKLGVDSSIVEGLRGAPMKAIEDVITPRSFYSIDLGLGREARAALSVSNLPVFLNDYLACATFDERPRLDRIRTKTLVLCGDADRMTPPKWAHYLRDNIEGADLRFVRDAGHMLPLEKPEILAGMLQGFLEGISR
jgi:pimeloyl-ACP methyl ester carboxylesterase